MRRALVDPSPPLSISDVGDGRSAHAEASSYVSDPLSFQRRLDLEHIVFGELRHTVALATVAGAVLNAIHLVCRTGLPRQVIWIDAAPCPIAARMSRFMLRRRRFAMGKPTNFPVRMPDAVAVRSSAERPDRTFVAERSARGGFHESLCRAVVTAPARRRSMTAPAVIMNHAPPANCFTATITAGDRTRARLTSDVAAHAASPCRAGTALLIKMRERSGRSSCREMPVSTSTATTRSAGTSFQRDTVALLIPSPFATAEAETPYLRMMSENRMRFAIGWIIAQHATSVNCGSGATC